MSDNAAGRDDVDLHHRGSHEGYFAPRHHRKSEVSTDSRMTLAEFLMTENVEVSERGAITREQLAHFVDLTYVATVFNINHVINGCGDSSSDVVLLALSFFFICFTTRYHFDIYSIMFYSVDLVHRVLFLAFNIGVFVMTYNIKATPMAGGEHRMLGLFATDDHTDDHVTVDDPITDDHHISEDSGDGNFVAGNCVVNLTFLQGFASGYLASRITLMMMYGLLIYFAHRNNEQNAKKTYMVKVVPLLIGAIVMLPIYWPSVNPVKILFAVGVIEVLGDIVPEVTNHYMQKYNLSFTDFTISMRPDVDHLQERLQEFFLIVLGESMIGLLIFHYNVERARAAYIATLFAFTLLFSLGSHFLVCVHRSADQVHAMKKKNALIRIIYIWLHPIICFVLLVSTNALVQLVEQISSAQSSTSDSAKRLKRTVSIGLCIVVLLMVTMRVMHKGVVDHLRTSGRKMHVIYKVCVAALHLALYWIVADKLYFILAHSFLATSTNVVEMLIPIYSQSRPAVDILFFRSTVDAEKAPGAQKELNSNRKSIVAKLAEVARRASTMPTSGLGGGVGGAGVGGGAAAGGVGGPGAVVELQPTYNKHHSGNAIRNVLHHQREEQKDHDHDDGADANGHTEGTADGHNGGNRRGAAQAVDQPDV